MRELELLAPAKNLECGITAINHGADAVYIGAQRFGARISAGNSVDDIETLTKYAHQFDAKVYVTINTILYDEEIEDATILVEELVDIEVDALLVQDMAMLAICADVFKRKGRTLKLHASTQTDNRTKEKALFLQSLGFSRIVLARELTITEIADISKAVSPATEIEVFVHGALCVSYSGQCYASEHCFKRSANRGECAQFCRMKFDLIDGKGNVIEHNRHLLSLKDLNLLDNLEYLIKAGATSFKIEGRLKDINYVKNVTTAYSKWLNKIISQNPTLYRRASRGECRYVFTPNLNKTFNRGFTSYFLNGRQPSIFSPDTPKALGEYVGRVKEIRDGWLSVAGTASFANGDGLCFINGKRKLEGFRVNRTEGGRLFPHTIPANLQKGMGLYRNNDSEFNRQLAHPESAVRKIPIAMALETTTDGFSLTINNNTTEIQYPHETAKTPQRENIIKQLTKLGNTIYECKELTIPDDFPYFVPSSVLADLRRTAIGKLQQQEENNRESACNMCFKEERSELQGQMKGKASYLLNVSNELARQFYKCKGIYPDVAFELKHPTKGPIMQCRHCLKYSLGCCEIHGGTKPSWSEPLRLRLSDGRLFTLQFDCKHCQMNVLI